MTTMIEPELMTVEQFLALPDDGMERELFDGKLREKPMTVRNFSHSVANMSIGATLHAWLRNQPEPRGRIVGGEAGFIIRRKPATTVGIDVAYISAEMAEANRNRRLIEGPPILAVEILSPSDTHEDIMEKIAKYLEAGVKLVWVAEPVYRTVTIYEAGQEPVLYNATQYLEGGVHLPGFRALVAELFI